MATSSGTPTTCSVRQSESGRNYSETIVEDGSYTVTYKLPEGAKGRFTYEVKVNGKNIAGSPWTSEL